MLRKLTAALALALLPILACGDDDPSGGPGGPGGGGGGGTGGAIACAIKIGTGDRGFVPLADGDLAEVVYGSQGGYHIWGSFLARGFPTDQRLLLEFDLDFEDGTPYRHTRWCINPLKDAKLVAGWREHTGIFGYFPFEADPPVDLAGGKKLRLRMSLRDRVILNGETAQCEPTGEPTCTAEASALVVPCQRGDSEDPCKPIP